MKSRFAQSRKSAPKTAKAHAVRRRQLFVGHVHTPLQFGRPRRLLARRGETVRALERRQKFRLPVVAVCNGEPLLRAEWGRKLRAGDELIFVTLPAGGSGGIKDVFRTVLQIAIVALATYFLGPAGLGLTGWALGAAVMATQIASSYLLNALMPPATPDIGGINTSTGSPTYSLQAQGNQARLGQPIPRLYGRHIFTPDFAAQPYVEYAGNDLFLYQLFSLGLGDYSLKKILIEDTELWNSVDGFSGNFSDIDFEICAPGAPVTLFPANVVTSVEVSGQTLDGPNVDGDYIGFFVANPAGTDANFLAFDFIWASGAGYVNDDGSIGNTDIQLSIEVRPVNDDGTAIGDVIVLDQPLFSFATRTQQRVSMRYPVEAGRYEARVKRLDDSSTDTRKFDEVSWAGLRSYIVSGNTFPKETVLAMRMRATNQLSGTASRKVRTLQVSRLPIWNGETWSAPQETRDIFPIAADILRNTVYGGGLPDRRIDIDAFVSLQATWTARGDTFDGVFDQRASIWSALSDVLRVGRSQPVMLGDVVSLFRDEKRLVPRAVFTPRNIVRNSFSADYILADPDTPDAVTVQFMDERTWNPNATVTAALPGSTAATPATISFFGCTDRVRAWKYGIYQAACNQYRRILPILTTELDGRLVRRGDSVLVAHPLPSWGQAADVRALDPEARKVMFSQRMTLGLAVTNFLVLRKPDASVWGPVIVGPGTSPYELVADAADLAAVIAAQGDWAEWIVDDNGLMDATVGVVGWGKDFARECLVVTGTPQGQTQMQLALVVDDDRVYTADAGDPPGEVTSPTLPVTPTRPGQPLLTVDVQGTKLQPVLVASVQPVPGAESIVWQRSYDFVTWDTVQAGPSLAWTGEVRPGPVWLRATAFGAIAGDPAEWFMDLTVSQAQPAAPTSLSVTAFSQHAWVDFALEDSEILAGVIAKVSPTTGFDPEHEGAIAYDGAVTKRVLIDLGEDGEVWVRIAAYNIYGKVGLNWSGELHIQARKLTSADMVEEVVTALNNATALDGAYVVRKDSDGNAAGFAIVNAGELQEVVAAFVVDMFMIALPGVDDPVPLFVVDEDGVRMNSLIAASIKADAIEAVWGDIAELVTGKIRSANSKMIADFDDVYIQMDYP